MDISQILKINCAWVKIHPMKIFSTLMHLNLHWHSHWLRYTFTPIFIELSLLRNHLSSALFQTLDSIHKKPINFLTQNSFEGYLFTLNWRNFCSWSLSLCFGNNLYLWSHFSVDVVNCVMIGEIWVTYKSKHSTSLAETTAAWLQGPQLTLG